MNEENKEIQSEQRHKSVLVFEVLEYLNVRPGKSYLDVTFGSGGHTRAILEKEPTCTVYAMDWDTRSLELYAPPLQEEFGDRFIPVWGNFALMYRILKKEGIKNLDGILADFGTSQMQITQRPGFSIYRDKPLDMRMSPSHQRLTAEHVLRDSSVQQLTKIFGEYGEERYSRRIANAIVEARKIKSLTTTRELACLIEKSVPHVARSSRKTYVHPATRVFQALRIYVNQELDNITAFLPVALEHLADEGRLVCISFHSLEDRLVKQFFAEKDREQLGRVITKKVVVASDDEERENPSSRSAKLRAFEKIKNN